MKDHVITYLIKKTFSKIVKKLLVLFQSGLMKKTSLRTEYPYLPTLSTLTFFFFLKCPFVYKGVSLGVLLFFSLNVFFNFVESVFLTYQILF